MNTTTFIAHALTEAFFGGNWSEVDFKKTLSEVDFKLAQAKVPFTENTISRLVYHLKYNNEMMVNRANGIQQKFNEKESFAAPILNSDEDWQKLTAELFSTAKNLIKTIKNFDERELQKSIYTDLSSACRNFQGVSEHFYYHFGQIVMIKKYLETLSK